MRYLAIIFLSSILSLAPFSVKATAQEPDLIIVDGKTHSLNTNPLSSYLIENPNLLPKTEYQRTSNWRGYTATWAIQGDQLFLNRVEMRFPNPDKESRKPIEKDVLPQLFPTSAPVPAIWYTGALIIPDGEQVEYAHMGYGSTYSHYLIFRIEAGKVIERLALDQKAFENYRLKKFKAYTKTSDFKSTFSDLKKRIGGGMSDTQLLQFMSEFYSEQYLAQ